MRARRRHHPRVLTPAGRAGVGALVAILLLLSLTSPTFARHNVEERVTEDTAYTLRDKELRVGLWKLQFGVWEDLTLSTYNIPWLALFGGVFIPNGSAKYQWRINDEWSLAPSIGYLRLRLDLGNNEDSGTGATFGIVPIDVIGSWRINDGWSASLGLSYTRVFAEGDAGGAENEFRGAAAVSNLQWVANGEWRWSNRTALYLTLRALIFQQLNASTTSTIQVDDFTTIDVAVTGSSNVLNFERAASLTGGVVWSFDSFNLRLGLTAGNYNIPGVNFVLPVPIVFPEFDMYWRF